MGEPGRPDRLWDWLAGVYDRRAKDDEQLARALALLPPHLRPDDAVLDVGCASGYVASCVAPLVASICGVDPSERMIALARERGLANASFHRATVLDPELPEEGFDAALALNVLHLLGDAPAALRRVRALLRPGGRLVALTPTAARPALLRALLALVPRVGLLSHLELRSERELRALLADAGFEVASAETLDGPVPSWFAVARAV